MSTPRPRGIGLKLIAAFAMIAGFSLSASHAHAAPFSIVTYNVNTTYDGPNAHWNGTYNGTIAACADTEVVPKCSLRAAIEASSDGYTSGWGYNEWVYINVPGNLTTASSTVITLAASEGYLDEFGYTVYLQGPQVLINPAAGIVPKVVIDGSNLLDGTEILYQDAYGMGINYITFTGGSGTYGGCIDNEYTMSMSNDWVHDCGIGPSGTAAIPDTNEGGGIYNDDNFTSLNTWLQRNHAEYGGGLYNNENAQVNGGQYTDNTADLSGYGEGGGAYNDSNLQMTNVQMLRNIAGGTTPGDALYNTDGYGGAIYNYYYLQFNNGSIGNGGSPGTYSTNGNVAGYDGGGVYNYDYQAVINYSTISGNIAGDEGGGTYDDDEYEYFNHDSFSFNVAGGITSCTTGYGGGSTFFYVGNVSNSTYSYNAAYDCYTGPKALAVSAQAKSFNRRAHHINTVPVYHKGPHTVAPPPLVRPFGHTDARPTHVTPKVAYTYGGYGGAVYDDSSYTSYSNVNFLHNNAYDGGAYYDDYGDYINFNASIFMYNHADDNGGAFYQADYDYPVNFSTGQMTHNSAGNETGGLWDYESYEFLLNQFTVANNTDTYGCPNFWIPCS